MPDEGVAETALGCNHQSICILYALVPNVLPGGMKHDSMARLYECMTLQIFTLKEIQSLHHHHDNMVQLYTHISTVCNCASEFTARRV